MAKLHHAHASSHGSGITRRRFIQAAGALGGSTAAFSALSAWGHHPAAGQATPVAIPMDGPPELEGGGGQSVVVLGAGPAGLTAAYELGKRGYEVQVLEANDRVGGRVFTARRGSRSEEIDNGEQVCEFDENQWVDMGAWRIPYIHRGIHHYMREFRIPTIQHMDTNLNAFLYFEGIGGALDSRPIRQREMLIDMRGHSAELLATALNQDLLDTDLTGEDIEKFNAYLVATGLISESDLTYGPNLARGWEELFYTPAQSPEGARLEEAGPEEEESPARNTLSQSGDQRGIPSEPYALPDLLALAEMLGDSITWFTSLDLQPVMTKPANGMSQLYEDGFQLQLSDRILFESEVTEIHQGEDGVEIVYLDRASGETRTHAADYCVSTIPLPVLRNLQTDFSDETQAAIEGVPQDSGGKMGMQFKRRFWEEDDWIYGGDTYFNNYDVTLIGYPTYRYHEPSGALLGYYNSGDNAARVGDLSYEERIELALEWGSKVHPQYRDEFMNGFSVAWQKMPYELAAWALWDDETMDQYWDTLAEPLGRVYLAGDWLSYVPGWMEGAIQVAWMQIEKLHQRAMQESVATPAAG